MPGKAKTQKHSAKELSAKAKAATENVGGGKAGLADRKGGAAGHSRYKCPICMATAPDMKTMQIHYENKHPTIVWDPAAVTDLHAANGFVTTAGLAVRGSKKK